VTQEGVLDGTSRGFFRAVVTRMVSFLNTNCLTERKMPVFGRLSLPKCQNRAGNLFLGFGFLAQLHNGLA